MNSKLLLILKYLWDNTDENNTVSLVELLQHLSENGVSSDRKTVSKYIDTLTDFGFDIIKVRKTQNQYFIGTRHFEAPEVKLLIDAVQSSRFITKRKSTDLIQNTDIYVTGSNSKFLSKDIITEFRGRGDKIHIYPLSFKEFMGAYDGDRYHI